MKYDQVLLLLVFLSFFASCQQHPIDNLQQFKKIDSSLQVLSVAADSNSVAGLNRIIQLKKDKNIQLALKADVISQSIEKTNKYIDSLNDELNYLDPGGQRQDIGGRFFGERGVRSILVVRFNDVYNSCNAVLADSSVRGKANDIVVLEREQLLSKNWLTKFVHDTPTVGIVSLLNKVKTDCAKLAELSLKGVINKLAD